MSRVAKKSIKIPAGISVAIDKQNVSIKGGKGTLQLLAHPSVSVVESNAEIQVSPKGDSDDANMQAATTRALLNNMVIGINQGFQIKLILIGVGFRATVEGKKLALSLGFSHPVNYPIPEGIVIETPSQTEIIVKGIDKQRVGQVAAEIRAYRPVEPYKGKGVRYEGEVIKLKEAKKK
jgi:large subunit ribosomal protein L6